MKPCRTAFGTLALVLAGVLITQLATADPLPNAWQITDNSTAGGSVLYYTNILSAAHRFAATNHGFRYTVQGRFLDNLGGSKSINMIYGMGAQRYQVWWYLDGNGDLVAEFEGGPMSQLTTNGTGSWHYHTHEIIYNSGSGTASYAVDGMVVISNVSPNALDWPAGTVHWGAGSSAGKAQMNFHRVTFEITNTIVAEYNAGVEPTLAPDPRLQGWTNSPVVPVAGTSTNGISPDTALRPVATTLAADQFTPTGAQLNGQANPSGSPAMAWFEWGTSTNYGNLTAPQPVGAGVGLTGFSNSINGLIVGLTYHFRAVVSNAFAFSYGTDQTFNLDLFTPSATTLPAVITTHLVNPAQVRLNGQVDPGGMPTMAWFEWGTNTSYGNITSPQGMGAGTSSTNLEVILNGLEGGPTYHYRAVASNAFGVAIGADQTFSLGFLVTLMAAAGIGVYESSVAWGDYDNDGRLDFLWTGHNGSSSAPYYSRLLRNRTNVFVDMRDIVAPDLPGVGHSSVAWGDYDNDGQLDFLFTGYHGQSTNVCQLWRNTGSAFSNVTASVAPDLRGVQESSVAWGDYDNDGRLDFLLTGTTNSSFLGVVSQLWRNTGSGFSNVTANVAPGLPEVWRGSVAWGDYDNDGRLDFLLTGTTNSASSGRVSQLWHNTGSGFSNVTASVAPGLPGVWESSVAWGDYDSDGWLDFLLTGQATGITGVSQVWQNTGGGFSNVTASVAPGLPGVFESSVAWGDFDSDGRLDFLLTGDTGPTDVSQLWQNTGSGFSNVTASVASSLMGISDGSVAWGDFNNDGRLDFLLTGTTNDGGNSDNFTRLCRNNLPLTNTPPAAPAGLSATVSGNTVLLYWNAPLDDFTPSAGLNYNLRIGTTPGGSDVLAPMAGTNGLRLLPALGNAQTSTDALINLPFGRYYWSVQALDTSFAGSPFAVEQQFTIAPRLINPAFSSGVFEFYFTNQSVLSFDVLMSTNAALPVSSWANLGPAAPLGGGLYQFTNVVAPNQPQRFYLLRQQ